MFKNSQIINIVFPEEMLKTIRAISEIRGLSTSSIIRDFTSKGILAFKRENQELFKEQDLFNKQDLFENNGRKEDSNG